MFLAARCMVYLAGGDPLRDRIPDTIPAPMRQFLMGCLLPGPHMRPDDAWAVLDEFDDTAHSCDVDAVGSIRGAMIVGVIAREEEVDWNFDVYTLIVEKFTIQ